MMESATYYDALYARQSVERADSISIESQLEYCRFETHGGPYQEYIDRGYSGKNTNRPAFEEMLEDIRQGKITRVIVYKLDRISRSILDFANMMDVFQKYSVEFVSSTEHFDTSTPIGRAMLNICIVFAQLERETIQKRVTDAYYARCRRGFYMGGRIPYGFAKTDTVIDGVRTSMYVPVPEEAQQIRRMYELYANPENSLGDIIADFNERGFRHLRGGVWTTARLSEMLRNPVYVRADVAVYDFFREQGANIVNSISDFTGYNACYLYQGTVSTSRRQGDLHDKEIVLAPHEGIVSSHVWLKCRRRCLQNRRSTRTCRAKNSWLSGKVKCGRCGHSLTIAKANTRWGRYFVCSGALATKKMKCQGTGCTIYADMLEDYMRHAIGARLAEFPLLSKPETSRVNPLINEKRIRLAGIEKEIEELLLKTTDANAVLLRYIGERVEALDEEKRRLMEEMRALAAAPDEHVLKSLIDPAAEWETCGFGQRQAVADILVSMITIAEGKMTIMWNI
ncbi:MAG: recombinase family protein [Lachnospiraceae bacterium]|nr:recombinase family protein [Lachnospiraceae bacterium]